MSAQTKNRVAQAFDDFECAKCRVYATLAADIAYHSVGRHELRAPQPTERLIGSEPRIVAECGGGFDCPHGRHYTNRHDAENCPHGDYDGPPLDAKIYHRAAGHDVREVSRG